MGKISLGKKDFRSKIHYGWYVLAACFAMLFFNSGARYSFGVMFKPMIAEFGWSRGSISFAFFLNSVLWALSLVFVGRVYDRFGPRWIIIIGTVLISAGYALVSLIDSLWQFCICYGILVAIGMGGTAVPLIAALMSRWFVRWRGLAISMALSGNCLGQFALVPLFTLFALKYGWRASYLAIGLIMFAVNVTMALLVVKGDPDDLGKDPFGYSGREKQEGDGLVSAGGSVRDLGLREAMRTYSFWLFLIAMFICGSGDFLVTAHLIPYVTDHGISPTTAGHMLAWFGLMALGGVLGAGPASDLIGNKIPLALTFLIRFLSFLLILNYQTTVSFYIFSLTFGFTYLITGTLIPTTMGRLYGFLHIGVLSGFVTTVHHLGGGFWAYMGGFIFDRTGSYQLAFILSAFMTLIAFFCCILFKEERHHPIEDV